MAGKRIVVIGSGNVATHLALALDRVAEVAEVCSPTPGHAASLAGRLRDCRAVTDVRDIDPGADFYLIAVNDDNVGAVAAAMPRVGGVVMHTSGSVGIDALRPHQRRAVFYPLQTFSRDKAVDVSRVPFFTEASDPGTLAEADALAAATGGAVHHADSQQRAVLHISAVFACNFTNHLWAIADDMLRAEGYTLDVLRPLLQVTLDKALADRPARVQTGPAARRDTGVMDRHMQTLDGTPREIYALLSRSIMDSRPEAEPQPEKPKHNI